MTTSPAPQTDTEAAPEEVVPAHPWAELVPEHFLLLRLAPLPTDRHTGARPSQPLSPPSADDLVGQAMRIVPRPRSVPGTVGHGPLPHGSSPDAFDLRPTSAPSDSS